MTNIRERFARKCLLGAAAAVTLLANPFALFAAPVAWDGGGRDDHSWHNALNWNTDVVPSFSSDVAFSDIAKELVISWTGDAFANSLLIQTRAAFTLSGGQLLLSSGSLTREEVSAQAHETETIDAFVFLGANGVWRIEGGAVNVGSLNDAGGVRNFTKRGTKPLYVVDAAYTGTTSVTEGVLRIDHTSSSGFTVSAGAELQISSLTTAAPFTLGAGALRNLSGNSTTGQVTLNGNSQIIADGGTLSLSGGITDGAGTFGWTKSGAGTVMLPAAGNYQGTTLVAEGTLEVTAAGALGTGNVTVSPGATLALPGGSIPNHITLGGSLLTPDGATLAGGLAVAGNVTIDPGLLDTSSVNINGPITDTNPANSLTKLGPGTLALNGANTSSGLINVNAGILSLGSSILSGSGAITVETGASLDLRNGVTIARPLQLKGGGFVSGGDVTNSLGNNTLSGPIALLGDTQVGALAGRLTISGNISGDFNLSMQGNGEVVLSGNNTHGNTSMVLGRLTLQSNGALAPDSMNQIAGALDLSNNITTSPTAAVQLVSHVLLPEAGRVYSIAGNNTFAGVINLISLETMPEAMWAGVGAAAGSTLTLSNQVIDEGIPEVPDSLNRPHPLVKVGPGTVILTAANTYRGGTIVQAGTLSISSDSNLGAATGPVTLRNDGKLLVTANMTSARIFNLNSGSIQPNPGVTLSYNGATVTGGFLRGPGPHAISGPSTFSSVTTLPGSNVTQSATASFNNVTNGGTLTNQAVLSWDGGVNASSGAIVNNSTINTTAFANNGVIAINSGASLINTGNTLTSGGGSRITISPGGTLNVAGNALDLNGALLVNNGTITGPTNVNYGSLAKGAGVFGPVNVTDGGRFAPGNSPGAVTTGSATWGAGGGYLFEINNTAGTQGTNWDLWNIDGSLNVTAGATTNSRFTIGINSLTAGNAPGPAANFNNAQNYSWLIASATAGIGGFDISKFTLDSSGFSNPSGGGSFALAQVGNNLFLNFSASGISPPQWNVDTDGSWANANNWLPTLVPNASTTSANFLGKITAPRTVTLDGNKTVGVIAFDNANSYTIAGAPGGTLTIGDGTAGSITVASGQHTISAPLAFSGNISRTGAGTLTISGPQNHNAASSLTASNGQLNLNSNSGTAATLASAAVARLGLSINNSGHVTLGVDQDLRELSLTTSDPGAQSLDLNSHSVRVYSGDLALAKATLYNALRNANSPGALNPADGIYDSSIPSHLNSALGLGLHGDVHGELMILIRPTRIGDLNLDGNVTISDFIDLASHFGLSGTWQEGDLNYDGNITISDFIDLASNFGQSYAGDALPITPRDQVTLADFAASIGAGAVPEPSALLALLVPALAISHRRRRHP